MSWFELYFSVNCKEQLVENQKISENNYMIILGIIIATSDLNFLEFYIWN